MLWRCHPPCGCSWCRLCRQITSSFRGSVDPMREQHWCVALVAQRCRRHLDPTHRHALSSVVISPQTKRGWVRASETGRDTVCQALTLITVFITGAPAFGSRETASVGYLAAGVMATRLRGTVRVVRQQGSPRHAGSESVRSVRGAMTGAISTVIHRLRETDVAAPMLVARTARSALVRTWQMQARSCGA